MARYLGIDVGAESIKIVELTGAPRDPGVPNVPGAAIAPGAPDTWRCTRRALLEHHKQPGETLRRALPAWDLPSCDGAAVTGRLSRIIQLPRIPAKQAQVAGFRFLFGERPATVVSIGSHGFSVLEIRAGGTELLRENSRCSQGTGNFLRQLVERFDLDIAEAAALAEGAEAAALSGRCPVILKTDMTHLTNLGENRARILAGLFDAVCENVQVLIKPAASPPALLLTGGVCRARRVREHFERYAGRHDMHLLASDGDDALYLDALGCALEAARSPLRPPALAELVRPRAAATLESRPPLAQALGRVRRLTRSPLAGLAGPAHHDLGHDLSRDIVLGLDIGSTGSKAVALTRERAILWEHYVRTNGNPVAAAQALVRAFCEAGAQHRVRGFGVTGSGREIAGSLLASCYGGEAIYVLNEIAAHAEGALFYDRRVDTIFEIGGQDAKYVRLSGGRIVDAAMNEACSAGTGSFIEEQGRRFGSIGNVADLGAAALAAPGGVALGQHCSVFMAEIVDEAVAAGVDERAIIAGLYDSVVQNYLHRVKGSRSVGQVIFCQGMPFASDALGAAVARQTGREVIVPPSPGTVGALGIALLHAKSLVWAGRPPLELARFLEAGVESKDTFVCSSTAGCGGTGNKCRIDRLATVVAGERRRFTWGGGCSLYDKGTRKQKLPDRAPDPFREREALVREIAGRCASAGDGRSANGNRSDDSGRAAGGGRARVAMTDEFQLKGLYPFFATFVHALGFEVVTHREADRAALKRGIQSANVPFCAPMQQYHGLVAAMADARPDYLFLPMLRELPRVADEPISVVCPVVQASPDLLRADLGARLQARVLSPVVDIGPGNLDAPELAASCRELAAGLGVRSEPAWRAALTTARAEQLRFDARLLEIGASALAFCAAHGVTPVVVLGRSYTLYNQVLNSNVPALLREQGAVAIPVDCYPVDASAPVFEDMFWGHGQRILRAAHQIRRTAGVYSLFCSNYSCGPDSFVVPFYGYVMEGKPFAIIETDGHSGDAGTKTRIEAFLHCVREDLEAARARGATAAGPTLAPAPAAAPAAGPAPEQTPGPAPLPSPANELGRLERAKARFRDVHARGERVLIPRMGPGANAVAAALRGYGLRAEALPVPDREALYVGRRHTSGKECVPMTITLGSLLERVAHEQNAGERFAFLMPGSRGPCRFGAYNLLHKIVLERLGLGERVRVWSPPFDDYFEGLPSGFAAVCFAAIAAADVLLAALYDVRPVERRPGAAEAIYRRYAAELEALLETAGRGDLSSVAALAETASGRLYGVTDLLARAAAELANVKGERELPTVLVVGEIYVRCDPFANDFVIDKLEQRGIRARLAPMNEWIEYSDFVGFFEGRKSGLGERVASLVQRRIRELTYTTMARRLRWPARTAVQDSLRAAAGYVRERLEVETVLTLGAAIHEWREGVIDAVLSTGPLECMPNKIAESQFHHVAEREGLPSLTLALNGDPLDPEILDPFAYEIHARFRGRPRRRGRDATPAWAPWDRAARALRPSLEGFGALASQAWPLRGDPAEDEPS